jgi:hypothetical protein
MVLRHRRGFTLIELLERRRHDAGRPLHDQLQQLVGHL